MSFLFSLHCFFLLVLIVKRGAGLYDILIFNILCFSTCSGSPLEHIFHDLRVPIFLVSRNQKKKNFLQNHPHLVGKSLACCTEDSRLCPNFDHPFPITSLSRFTLKITAAYRPIGLEYSLMARETRVQSQVESYQTKKVVLDTSFLNTQQYKECIKG